MNLNASIATKIVHYIDQKFDYEYTQLDGKLRLKSYQFFDDITMSIDKIDAHKKCFLIYEDIRHMEYYWLLVEANNNREFQSLTIFEISDKSLPCYQAFSDAFDRINLII